MNLEVELLGHMVTVFFCFSEEAPYCFPQWLFHFTFPPTGNRGSGFSTRTLTPIFWFGGNSHPDGYELVVHCSFD